MHRSEDRVAATRHYIVFEGGPHTNVIHIRSGSLRHAIETYILEKDSDVSIEDNGGLIMAVGNRRIHYQHPLSFVEANYKRYHEWQIREVPDIAWDTPCTSLFCGENPAEVEDAITACRHHLRKRHPRAQAHGFLWYLQGGWIVTFYQPRRQFQIEVLGRYLQDATGRVSEWAGSYDDILDQLWGPQPIVQGL